jgi:N-acetylmuramoyl-L-alanine amidase
LPPCSRVFNEQSEEVFQDIWNWTNKDSKWNLFNADGKYLVQRATLANKYSPDLFVSLHADMLRSWNTIDDKTKILSIKYDERQGNKDSEKIAQQLLDNWFWYYYQWNLSPDVNRDVAQQHLWVLKTAQSPAVLIEFWNISQESQAYILREYSKREELAKNFVSSLIKVYKK